MIVLDRLISSVQKIGNTVIGFTIEINHINDPYGLTLGASNAADKIICKGVNRSC